MPAYQKARRRATSLETDTRSVTASIKRHLLACLRSIGDDARADKLDRCSREFRVLSCPNGHVFNPIPLERCGYRLCPDCARWRQGRAFHRVYPALLELQRRHPNDRWVLITLTAKSSDALLRSVVKRFKGWFGKLRRSKEWKRCIRAAVAGFEVVYHKGQGWHFHVHLLASRMHWWDQADLADAWERATGGEGQIVDIRQVKDLRSGVAEALKYIMKPTNLLDWGAEQVRQFQALGRTKLRECYGALRGLVGDIEDDGEASLGTEPEELPLQEGDACPSCGGTLQAQWLTHDELFLAIMTRNRGMASAERGGAGQGLIEQLAFSPKPPASA